MKKYLLLGFLVLVPFLTKAQTTVYGFMNGNFYDVGGNLKYACLMDGNCFDYSTQGMTTLNQILGGSSTITVTDGLPTPTPIPTPTIIPTPTPIPQPTLLPPYTSRELSLVLGWTEPTLEQNVFRVEPQSVIIFPFASSQSGAGAYNSGIWKNVSIWFNNQLICGPSITTTEGFCLTPFNGTGIRSFGEVDDLLSTINYPYTITYTETGRQDTIINGNLKIN